MFLFTADAIWNMNHSCKFTATRLKKAAFKTQIQFGYNLEKEIRVGPVPAHMFLTCGKALFCIFSWSGRPCLQAGLHNSAVCHSKRLSSSKPFIVWEKENQQIWTNKTCCLRHTHAVLKSAVKNNNNNTVNKGWEHLKTNDPSCLIVVSQVEIWWNYGLSLIYGQWDYQC